MCVCVSAHIDINQAPSYQSLRGQPAPDGGDRLSRWSDVRWWGRRQRRTTGPNCNAPPPPPLEGLRALGWLLPMAKMEPEPTFQATQLTARVAGNGGGSEHFGWILCGGDFLLKGGWGRGVKAESQNRARLK